VTAEESKRILLTNDQRVRAVTKALRSVISDLCQDQPRATDATAPDDSFHQRHGAISVDRLLVALHLTASRVLLRAMPKHWKMALASVASSLVTGVAGKVAAKRAAGKIPGAGQVIEVLRGAFTIPSRLAFQAGMEKDIRSECAAVRKLLNVAKPRRNRRVVQDVRTRHYRAQLSKPHKDLKSR